MLRQPLEPSCREPKEVAHWPKFPRLSLIPGGVASKMQSELKSQDSKGLASGDLVVACFPETRWRLVERIPTLFWVVSKRLDFSRHLTALTAESQYSNLLGVSFVAHG